MLTRAQIDAWEAAFDAAQVAVKRLVAELPSGASDDEIDAAFAPMQRLGATPLRALQEARHAD